VQIAAVMDAIKPILMAALLATMCAEGMRVSPADLGTAWKHPSKIARGVIAVIVLVPIIAVVTAVMLRPSRPVVVGLAFLAASPLAPFILSKLAKSGESFRLAASLHVALACLSIFTAPLVLAVLGRVLGFPAVAPPLAIAGRVVVSLLIPFGIGVALRAYVPRVVARIRKGLEVIGMAALLVAVAVLIVVARGFFLEFGLRDYAAMTLFCVLAHAGGHFMAANEDERTTYALESAARNPGIALLMATSSLGAVRGAVLVPYLVVFIIVSTVYSVMRKRGAVRSHLPSVHGRESLAP